MAGNVEIPKRFLQRLMCDNEKAKDMLRETQIKEKVASISGPGPKRAVAHHMRSLFLLEDMSDVWTDIYEDKLELEKEAKEKGEVAKVPLVRADNLEEVAEALVRQEEFWKQMKEHIIYELGMQTLGGKSKYGFKLVKHREDDPDFDKELLSFDESDVRSWEKAFVQREREFLKLFFWLGRLFCILVESTFTLSI